ncbi:MAG: hypothetical protein ABI177_10865 [Edaphobacter sp.]
MRKLFGYALILIFAITLTAQAAQTKSQTEAMSCSNDDPPLTSHNYGNHSGDILQTNHLEATRPFNTNGKLELSVCRADLRVITSPNAKEIKLTVEVKTHLLHSTVADDIRTLRVEPDHGLIELKFPKQVHATVTLTMPMGPDSASKFTVGFGNLDFNAIGSSGNREINVGMGHLQLLLDDETYATMQVNVGMGSFHDHRPNGHSSHFNASRNYQGRGSGPLKINVGMGSVDIRNH